MMIFANRQKFDSKIGYFGGGRHGELEKKEISESLKRRSTSETVQFIERIT